MVKKGSVDELYLDEINQLQQNRRNWNTNRDNIDLSTIEDLSKYPIYVQSVQTLTNFIKSKEHLILGDINDPFYNIVEESISNMKINNVINDFMDFLTYGYKLFEVVYKVNNENKIIIDHLSPVPHKYMTRNYQNISFDEKGQIVSVKLGYNDIVYNYPKFIFATYNMRNNDIFGNPVLTRDLGDTIYMARENKVNRQIFNYKHSNPTIWQRINHPERKNIVLNFLSKIGNGLSNLTIGQDEEVGLLESSHDGESFKSTINDCNQEIALSLFIGNLLYGQGETGSYSQSETHITMLYNNLNSLIYDFDDFINNLIEYLWVLNMPESNNSKSPIRFVLNKFRKNDYKTVFEILRNSPLELDDEDSEWYKCLIKQLLDEELNYVVDQEDLQIKGDGGG